MELKQTAFTPFTPNELKPAGWLKRQLEIQAKGLSGNLHKVWPDIRDSAWIGGDREGWERVPYWLDGLIPLAYLLEDQELIQTAKTYLDAILSRQQEDGWICPCPNKREPPMTCGQQSSLPRCSQSTPTAPAMNASSPR